MKKRSFQIALSAVSAALATVFMIIGLNVPFAFITGYIFGAIALMLPLAEGFWAGGFLAYLAASLLCLPFGGIAVFYKLFPFIAFFGLHPLVNSFQRKWKINRWIAWAVKAVWFVGMLCAAWALFSGMFSVRYEWLEIWAYPIIVVGGAAVFLLYDWLMIKAQDLVDLYVLKIDRGGRGKSGIAKRTGPREDVADVFGDLSGQNENECEGPAENAPEAGSGPEDGQREPSGENTEKGESEGKDNNNGQ